MWSLLRLLRVFWLGIIFKIIAFLVTIIVNNLTEVLQAFILLLALILLLISAFFILMLLLLSFNAKILALNSFYSHFYIASFSYYLSWLFWPHIIVDLIISHWTAEKNLGQSQWLYIIIIISFLWEF